MAGAKRRPSNGWHRSHRIPRRAAGSGSATRWGCALLPAGRAWDVLILPGALGHPTLDVLTRILDRPGPVLVDFGDDRMGFFVAPGTAARWLGTGIRTRGGRHLDRRALSGPLDRRTCAGWSRRTAPAP